MTDQPKPVDAARHMRMVVALELIGWHLVAVDADIPAEMLRIELRRGNLRITYHCDHGRASITREVIERRQEPTGRRGDRCIVERIGHVFLGRLTGMRMREGLRALSHYVADNAPTPIPHDQGRNIFRPLLAIAGSDHE